MTDLPPGWEWAELAEVANVQGGIQKQAKRRPIQNKFPFLRVANVHRGRLDLTDIHEVELFEGELERYQLKPGDLLVVEGNGSPDQIGRAAIWDGSIGNCVHQNHLIRVRPTNALIPKFLEFTWNSPTVSKLLRHAAGSTSGLYTLSTAKLKSIRLPIPPLPEQRRIVATLEDHLSHLEAGSTSIATSNARLERLIHALTERLLSPAYPHTQKLGSLVAEKMSNGRSVPTRVGGFPVLRLTALQDGRVDLAERKPGDWTLAEAAPFLVKKGDFLASRGNGSIRLVGRGGLVNVEPDPVAFPDTLIRIRTNPTELHPNYLTFVWNSPYVRKQIERAARTTAGIYKINQAILNDILLPVPPIDEQVRIVQQWQAVTSGVERLDHALADTVARGHSLRSSLLTEAFGGRLVEQDPNDEPASELLARIRAERAAAIPKQRTRVSRTRKELPAPPTRVTGDNYQQGELPL